MCSCIEITFWLECDSDCVSKKTKAKPSQHKKLTIGNLFAVHAVHDVFPSVTKHGIYIYNYTSLNNKLAE